MVNRIFGLHLSIIGEFLTIDSGLQTLGLAIYWAIRCNCVGIDGHLTELLLIPHVLSLLWYGGDSDYVSCKKKINLKTCMKITMGTMQRRASACSSPHYGSI